MRITRTRHLIRRVTTTIAVSQLAACMVWRVETAPTPQVLDRDNPEEVRVRLKDGREYLLRDPRISHDSLGHSLGAGGSIANAAHLNDIQDVSTRHVARWRTAGLIAVEVAVAAALVYALLASSFSATAVGGGWY